MQRLISNLLLSSHIETLCEMKDLLVWKWSAKRGKKSTLLSLQSCDCTVNSRERKRLNHLTFDSVHQNLRITPEMLGAFSRKLRPALKQVQLLRGVKWRQEGQIRACAARSATFHLLEDCLGEFDYIWTQFIRICEAELTINTLRVKSPVLNYGGTPMHFNYVWLRDHCRSASSYNSQTNQRNLDTGSIDLAIRPDKTSVEDGHLVLTCKYSPANHPEIKRWSVRQSMVNVFLKPSRHITLSVTGPRPPGSPEAPGPLHVL